jgi:uncharacterized protein YjdB
VAEVLPEDASDKSVIWSVENGSGVATIDSNGLLTAWNNGTVMAVATSMDGLVRGELEVTISNQDPRIPVSEIVVTGTGGVYVIDVEQGTLQMIAEVLPVDATIKSVTWSVENGTGVATIDSNGLLTAVSNGAVIAAATSADGLVKGEAEITISNQQTTGIFDSETGPDILVIGNRIQITMKHADPSWKEGTLKVFAMNGAEILATRLNHGHNEIDINHGPGIYILVLPSADGNLIRKVFID